MLRLLALILLLANLGYFAWTQGRFQGVAAWGDPTPTREPHRLSQQLRPDRVVLLATSKDAASDVQSPEDRDGATDNAASTSGEPTRCLQTPPLSDRQFTALNELLAMSKAEGAWVVLTTIVPGRWIVYSGKLASPAALEAYKAELRQLKVPFREPALASLMPGVAMGTYSSEANAEQALKEVGKAGVRNAKVALERAELTQYTLRLPKATAVLEGGFQQNLEKLAPELRKDINLQLCP